MADIAIGGFNVIASDGFGAAQMRIRRLFPDPVRRRFRGSSCWIDEGRRVERRAPQVGTTPIRGTPVIPEVCGLVLPGDGLVHVDVGTFLNLLFRQPHIQPLGLPVRMDYGDWRDQHWPAAEPAAGFYREVTDGPCLIVEIELIYTPELTVRGSDCKTFQVRCIRFNTHLPPLAGWRPTLLLRA